MHNVASTSMVLMQPKVNTGENRTQTSTDIQASQKNPVKAETEVSNTTGKTFSTLIRTSLQFLKPFLHFFYTETPSIPFILTL